jgi:hypothetical protein
MENQTTEVTVNVRADGEYHFGDSKKTLFNNKLC